MMQLTGKKFVFESVEPVLAPDAREKSKEMLTFFVMMAQEIWKDVTLCFCEDGTLTAQGGGIGADLKGTYTCTETGAEVSVPKFPNACVAEGDVIRFTDDADTEGNKATLTFRLA